MTSSLIPERPLLISPTLAATIGLEETVMLHVISELFLQHPLIVRKQRRWAELDYPILQKAMPFWSLIDIKRVRQNLQEKGLVHLDSVAENSDTFLIAINQPYKEGANLPSIAHKKPSTLNSVFNRTESSGKASFIPPNWQPNEDLYQQFRQHNIPQEFVNQRIKSFVMYWREREKAQYSWHNTFLKWILKDWRKEQSFQGAKELESDMNSAWSPSGEALSILENAGVNNSFIEDSVPEFVLYWKERGLITSTWNTKFIAHIRRQWAKFTLAVENDPTPRLIPMDYEPGPVCFEVLAMANINEAFAREQIKEFILYWQDRKEAHPSWNTKFLQHVKYKWAHHLQSNLPSTQQVQNTIERFTDRSWAE
uniref:DnaT DNA-binding domain-containing protein n=1 Tax=SAR86 cluster bacterium TaxID=2030880 RepID=A0A2A5CHL9_9GAMM